MDCQLRLSRSWWLFLHVQWNPRSALWEPAHSWGPFPGESDMNVSVSPHCASPHCLSRRPGHRCAEHADAGRCGQQRAEGKQETLKKQQREKGLPAAANRRWSPEGDPGVRIPIPGTLVLRRTPCVLRRIIGSIFSDTCVYFSVFERIETWENPSCNKEICFPMNFWKIASGGLWV